ncbi:MAG TPA: hypothetical protein PKD78_11455 [Saprospiraceae bacterium]|nr:hypothetical protein [Saprospiraceae bacterium]
MQQRIPTRRQVLALLLAGIFLTAWLTKSVHRLVLHHHDAKRPLCALHDERRPHFHDERYAVDDCLSCSYVPALAEEPPCWVLPGLTLCPAPAHLLPAAPPRPSLWAGFDLTLRRGPPSLS